MPPGVADAVDSMLNPEQAPASPSSSTTEPCELHIFESPISDGLIKDWDVLQDVLDQTFREKLQISSKDHPVMFAHSPLITNYMREKVTEMMFEVFDVPGLYLNDTAALSLYCVGLETGLVVESGHATTHTCVVSEGRTLKKTIPKTFYAGKDITKYLSHMVAKRQLETSYTIDIEPYTKDMKEKMCFVSEDFRADFELAKTTNVYEKTYEFPNNESITLNNERLIPTESIFRPNVFGCNCPGIHSQIVRTLKLAEPEARKNACPNIVLSGGNTMFPGFHSRLQMELNRVIPAVLNAKVLEHPDQLYAAWTGGSKMAASESMTSNWITREEYDAVGSAIATVKCM